MRVVIAGGGPAAVEALLALDQAAKGRFEPTLLTPTPELELRALTVTLPFAHGHERRRFDLRPLAARTGARIVTDTLAAVAAPDRRVWTGSGEAIGYDALIVATGARALPAFDDAITFGAEPLALNGLLADIEEGYTRRLAFVVPSGIAWSLPAYELALLTRRQAHSMGSDAQITLVTPEAAPLAVFGRAASRRVGELLERAAIELHTGAHAVVGPSGRIRLAPSGELLDAQRVVALPRLEGPRIEGLPHDQDGFVPVDEHMQVLDLRDVYCVGDAANFPVKQGGLATQQADAAALHIAALAGARVTATPFRPVLRGRLITGDGEQFFVKELRRPASRVADTPLWWPPTKVTGRHLTPWLASVDPTAVPSTPAGAGVDVETELPADPLAARRAALSLDPLGAPVPLHR